MASSNRLQRNKKFLLHKFFGSAELGGSSKQHSVIKLWSLKKTVYIIKN